MSYPDALELAAALETGKATSEQVATSAARLRQFFALCKTHEATIGEWQIAADGKAAADAAAEEMAGMLAATAAEKEALAAEKSALAAAKEDVEAQLQAQHDLKNAQITTLQNQFNALLTEKEQLRMQYEALANNPQVIAAVDTLKQAEIAALEAKLAALKPPPKEPKAG